jgi:hypothetical protein
MGYPDFEVRGGVRGPATVTNSSQPVTKINHQYIYIISKVTRSILFLDIDKRCILGHSLLQCIKYIGILLGPDIKVNWTP